MPLAPGCRHALVAAVWVTKVTSVLCAASAAEASFRTLRRELGLQRQPKSVAQSLRLRGGASDATRGDVAQEQGSDPEMSEGAVLGVEQLGWERAEAWKRLADGETPDEEFHDSDLLSSDELHKLVREMVRPFLACRVCRACLYVCAECACGLGVCGVTPYTTMCSGRSKCPRGWQRYHQMGGGARRQQHGVRASKEGGNRGRGAKHGTAHERGSE